MDWDGFSREVLRYLPHDPLAIIDIAAAATASPAEIHRPVPGGYVTTVVRVRRGQGEFRRRLIARFGAECAVTGPLPLEALEAAHLYRYADHSRHEIGGGLLLRHDIHALFDVGLLSVDNDRVRIHTDLADFPVYAGLDGQQYPCANLGRRTGLAGGPPPPGCQNDPRVESTVPRALADMQSSIES